MNSLVLGFENKINDSKYSVTDLLRHCMIIARKLKQKEFQSGAALQIKLSL